MNLLYSNSNFSLLNKEYKIHLGFIKYNIKSYDCHWYEITERKVLV